MGHSSVAFTMQTYAHVIPGMDEDAASTIADLILRRHEAAPVGSESVDARKVVRSEATPDDTQSKEPAGLLHFCRSAGSSSSSGGRI